jgi:hypothetical protein
VEGNQWKLVAVDSCPTHVQGGAVPFDVQCDACGRKFRAPDTLAGKRVKCPDCQAVILVGAAAERRSPHRTAETTPASKAAAGHKPAPKGASREKAGPGLPKAKPLDKVETAEWHMQTAEGEQYGPVTKTELDGWVAEGRLDASCQVLQDGWDQWQWADEVYPELAETGAAEAEPENPFAAIGDAGPAPAVAVNPYAAPMLPTAAIAVPVSADQGAITPRARRALADTRPWVMFLAILGLVVGGFGAIGALAFLALVAMAAGGPGLLIGLMMLASPALSLVASYFLLSYGLRLGSFLRTNAVRELEAAMVAQKSFWKLTGIVTAAVLALYLVGIAMVVALGGLAAMSIKAGAVK